jgi:hypothetical protein
MGSISAIIAKKGLTRHLLHDMMTIIPLWRGYSMNQEIMRRIKNQPQVKVAALAYNAENNIRFVLFAAVFAGFFYFFGANLWLASGGG